jgi:hypothetical protein
MKKILLPLLLLLSNMLFSQGGIEIQYRHATRVPFNTIDINIQNTNEKYEMQIESKQMENHNGFEYSNIKYSIPLSKQDFDLFYQMALNFDYKEILIANEKFGIGLDGDQLSIKVGTYNNNVTSNFWSIDYQTEKRKLSEVRKFIKTVYAKAGLDKWEENRY